VPKPAEPDADAGRVSNPIDVARLQRSPDRRREHQAGLMPAPTGAQSLGQLPSAMLAQVLQNNGQGRDRASGPISPRLRSPSDVPRTTSNPAAAPSPTSTTAYSPPPWRERPPPSSATPTRMMDV
jgi:hypothetical protein